MKGVSPETAPPLVKGPKGPLTWTYRHRHILMNPVRAILIMVHCLGLFWWTPFAVAAPVDSTTTSSESSQTVYVTKSGKKYHRAGCRSLKKKGTPTDLNQARRSKTPCKVCKPSL
ncbi:MAG: hypothetical protein IPN19_06875 [Elusimicrobia bacterium]|nr:hypothetical protein [Elusimicrobiota bacterium]